MIDCFIVCITVRNATQNTQRVRNYRKLQFFLYSIRSTLTVKKRKEKHLKIMISEIRTYVYLHLQLADRHK